MILLVHHQQQYFFVVGRNVVRRRGVRRNNAKLFYGQVALHGYLVDAVDRRWMLLYSSSTGSYRMQDTG